MHGKGSGNRNGQVHTPHYNDYVMNDTAVYRFQNEYVNVQTIIVTDRTPLLLWIIRDKR